MIPQEYEHYQMQDALQQQQIDADNFRNLPQAIEMVQQQQAILVEQTNPKKVVKDIILRLRGLEETPDGSLQRIAEPKINKKGQHNVWYLLESHINQGVILSHLDEDVITKMMRVLRDNLIDNLSLNWKEYGVTKKTDLDDIADSILFNVFLALKRAEGQNEKNWLGRISIENISGGSRLPPMKKSSWMDKFKL